MASKRTTWAFAVAGAGVAALLYLVATGGGFHVLPDGVRSRIAPLEAAAAAGDVERACGIVAEITAAAQARGSRRVPKPIWRHLAAVGDACRSTAPSVPAAVRPKVDDLVANLKQLEDVPGPGAYAALVGGVLVAAGAMTALLVLRARRRQRRAMADFDVKT